jgi:16S rRNA (guanine527-N7)-methyltransferase
MEPTRIAELLQPFLGREELSPEQLQNLSDYLVLLLRWNAKTNLTAVREPEEIVARHFGESLFLAAAVGREAHTAIDLGSGAGFPGVPLKIYSPRLAVTLIESQNKKATFLKEVVRNLTLTNINVFSGRAEGSRLKADLVTLRAVEKFEQAVLTAADLLSPRGKLALLIGGSQADSAGRLLTSFTTEVLPVPASRERILLIAHSHQT